MSSRWNRDNRQISTPDIQLLTFRSISRAKAQNNSARIAGFQYSKTIMSILSIGKFDHSPK
jgi:hypothetical protein